MPIFVDLEDSEGSDWDFRSDRTLDIAGNEQVGFALVDGDIDAVDVGFLLVVNGVGVNPQAASVDFGGREINTAPVMIDGVAISRSVLVSDPAFSPGGSARFLDSFTNTTDAAITVQTVTNSGADVALQFTRTTSGDIFLDASDTGFVTDDGNTNCADGGLRRRHPVAHIRHRDG